MDEIKAESIVSTRLQTVLLALFLRHGAVAGVTGNLWSYFLLGAQRTHELGIRAALGADAKNLVSLVLGGGLTLTVIGLIIGLAGSLAMTRLLASLLFGVEARDPLTMVAAAITLILVSLMACYIPARRATRVDPTVALRHE